MGYLIPGIAAASTDDKVLVVSTATAALQDQLAGKDIPLALKAFERAGISGVDVVVAKGRRRHACPLKMEALDGSTMELFAESDEDRAGIMEVIKLWNQDKWKGLRDDMPVRLNQRAWMKIANTASSCSGRTALLLKAVLTMDAGCHENGTGHHHQPRLSFVHAIQRAKQHFFKRRQVHLRF